MSPTPRLWDSIAAPYRAGDLHDCVRLARQAVDENPYELLPRYLLACLYLALEEHALALLQYERLLPLAVGRGELFLALAAQRRLDQLHPPVTLHSRRYHAMHQWFVSLARGERKRRGPEAARTFEPHALVRLPVHAFAEAAERCAVESLGMEPREIQPETGLLWVVLHGRVRWTVLREGQTEAASEVAETGDLIVLPLAGGEGVRLRIEPETPAECLRLDPAVLSGVSEEASKPGVPAYEPPAEDPSVTEQVADLVAAAGGPSAPEASSPDAAPPPGAAIPPSAAVPPGAAAPPDAAVPTGAAHPPRPRGERPTPDPLGEPTIAVGAPIERRRETRLTVSFANKVALLGLAGTRVAPIPGALADLSASGASVRFRRGDLAQYRRTLEGALVSVHLTLPGDRSALRIGARVVWSEAPHEGSSDPESALRIGLEFVAMSPAVEARIERLVSGVAA